LGEPVLPDAAEAAQPQEPITYNGAWADLQAFIESDAVTEGSTLSVNPDPAVLGAITQTVTVSKSITITSSDPSVPIVMTGAAPAEEGAAVENLPHFKPLSADVILTLQNITLEGGGAPDPAIVIGEGAAITT
ncbi:MAG TPA: hypothetical protein DEB31_00005, partial [Clostridiales bacterium]|nr:hypothetical protein [Clostridiales bacterium]